MSRLPFLLLTLALTAVPLTQAAEYPRQLDAQTARTFPYNVSGQLWFSAGVTDYIASGTVIAASSILTAGHNLWDPMTGWSTDIEFRRGAYGREVLSQQYGNRILMLSGYRGRAHYYGVEDVRTFSLDMGGVRFANPLAGGGYAGWVAKPSLLTGSAYKIALGYGAELGRHNGDYPLFVTPDFSFYRSYGSFFENDSIYFEGGMSGGPVFARDADGKLYVTGIIVSGSPEPWVSGGVRIIDTSAATFIRTYLR
jgi:hypothetical protein